MAGKIPQSFIDELVNRIDIVDVIDARVPLKKAGKDFTACCPFHNEKTPSFTVSQNKQFYHCFGCGEHGTVIGFLMEYEHLSFVDAIEELASMANMEVPRDATRASADPMVEKLYPIMEKAAVYYQQQLREHPETHRAVEYLKQRGMSGEIAAEFGVGYAPEGWNSLTPALGQNSTEALIRAGLLIEKGKNGPYDRFRDRIMIPIRDRRGRVIAFGGRILDDAHGSANAVKTGTAKVAGPKYLNSPETPIFHKGRELYGLFDARKALRHPQKMLVVEGYMDVLALVQHGIRNVVATLGTATTPDHLESLFRVVPEVIFCFDGDRAGRDAAWRALENALPILKDGRQSAFLFLPDGEDPDSLVRKEGQSAFENRLEDAMPLSDFLFETLSKQVDTSSDEGKTRLVTLAKPLISRLPDGVFRQMMNKRLEEVTQLLPGQLQTGPRLKNSSNYIKNKRKLGSQYAYEWNPIRKAIVLLVLNPEFAQHIEVPPDSLHKVGLPGADILLHLLESLREDPHLTTAALLERWKDKPEGKHLIKLVIMAEKELPVTGENSLQEFLDAINTIETRLIEQRVEFFELKLRTDGLSKDEINEYNQLIMRK